MTVSSDKGVETRRRILKAGVKAWLKDPTSVTASNIGRLCGMTHANVLYHFPYGVKEAVAEYALKIKEPKIIAQLIAQGHKSVRDLSPTERMEYLKSIL